MAGKNIGIDRPEVERKRGHYRAYNASGDVIWEQKDFVVGIDKIPLGLPDGMAACTIMDGKTVVHKWNPWSVVVPELQ